MTPRCNESGIFHEYDIAFSSHVRLKIRDDMKIIQKLNRRDWDS